MTQYTKGQWVGDGWFDDGIHIYAGIDDEQHAVLVAVLPTVGRAAERGETNANARLLIAAPDLLEACQRVEVECRNQLMRLEVSGDVNGMATRTYRELAAVLLAAIDKATGKGT